MVSERALEAELLRDFDDFADEYPQSTFAGIFKHIGTEVYVNLSLDHPPCEKYGLRKTLLSNI